MTNAQLHEKATNSGGYVHYWNGPQAYIGEDEESH